MKKITKAFLLLLLTSFVASIILSSTIVMADSLDDPEIFDDPEMEDDTVDLFTTVLNPSRDYLIIVNDDNEYEFGSSYDQALQKDLIFVPDCYGEPTPIEKATYYAFSLLKRKLAEQDIEIELYSCYRTWDDQAWVYETYGNLEGWSEDNKVMVPGFSEHHTGLLMSFVVLWPSEEDPSELVWTEETAERRVETPELEVIYDSLADYGFIERYPEGKEDITGVPPEPYEIRFVGSSAVAHEIMDNDLCLEEYLE